MEKILDVDLTTGNIKFVDYRLGKEGNYGRGLALELVASRVPPDAGRHSPENAVAMVPGILTGCRAASCCRITIAAKKGKREGLEVCNISGNIPQKLASLSLAAVLIHGKDPGRNAILHISETGAQILYMPELEGKYTGQMVESLKQRFGRDAAILGVGKTADMLLSLSTFFCTYPDGEPEYHCPRNGFGDIWGSKGLRAVVIDGKRYFDRECVEKEAFFETGKKLAQIILKDEVCGGALPAYGSITLLEILKDKKRREAFLKNSGEKISSRGVRPEKSKDAAITGKEKGRKINYCCAPMCVVGCLNRHISNSGEAYSAPDQSEVMAALKKSFGIEDMNFTKQIQQKAIELGIVGTEFVTAAKMYLCAEGIEGSRENILALLEEIDRGTLVGRLVASRTQGIFHLYADRADLRPLVDRKAIEDESKFEISLQKIDKRYEDMPDLEYLYDQIFILENLGFCIFTSFALLNNRNALELMAKLFTYKTGIETDYNQLMEYAGVCRKREREFEENNSLENVDTNIPPFTKVLYRYFER